MAVQERAGLDWAMAKFEKVEADIADVKRIALGALKDAQAAPDKGEIGELKMKINQWDRWWKAIMLSIIAGVISVVGFVWSLNSRAADVEDSVDDVKTTFKDVTTEIDGLSAGQKNLRESLKDQKTRDKRRPKELKQAIIEALEERDTKMARKRKRRE